MHLRLIRLVACTVICTIATGRSSTPVEAQTMARVSPIQLPDRF